jgi:hypothetical protein
MEPDLEGVDLEYKGGAELPSYTPQFHDTLASSTSSV